MQANVNNNRGHIIWLSTLRGLAILLVFISHIPIREELKNLLFIIGRIGVVIFLMMAGYLAYNSVQRKTRLQFFVNRFLRIYPIYWILLFIAFYINPGKWSYVDLLKNITLFQEYLGSHCILVASWMLSIMIVFFTILCIIKNKLKKYLPYTFIVIAIGAILCATARYLKGLPFPTALFLLQLTGIIGCISKQEDKSFSLLELKYFVVFEISLFISTLLSYDNWPSYILAYNLGCLCFYLFKNYQLCNKLVSDFSDLGFTFFLGAGIPITILTSLIPSISLLPIFAKIIIQFFSTLVFAWLMTRFVEDPMLRWGKRITHEN